MNRETTAAEYKTYTVHVTFKNPAWDERDGFDYRDISARSKADAVRYARNRARDDGHAGVLYFKASEFSI